MKIVNSLHSIPAFGAGTWLERLAESFAAQRAASERYPLRVAITHVTAREATVETTFVELAPDDPYRARFGLNELAAPRRKTHQEQTFAVVQIIPTGVRCEVGGFAGDACPATNLLAAAADVVITHPNAVNASELNEMARNVLYVEGRSLDDFLLGQLALLPSRGNRIGTFIDPSGRKYVDDVINTLNAARAAAGIDCGLHMLAGREIGVRTEWTRSGCAVGVVDHPAVVLESAGRLLAEGAEAIGGVSVIHGVTPEEFSKHLAGEIPNPSGGIEAIITHLISKVFRVPTAHAPLPYYRDVKKTATHNPRASAEFISTPHYFCVLKGLARAPRLMPLERLAAAGHSQLTLNNVGAIVVPASCLGGIPALAAEYSNIPLIAVEENATLLRVTNDMMHMRNVIPVRTYTEAAGVVLALRNGLCLESLRRPLHCARQLQDEVPLPNVAIGS
ncbi:MAG TPA: DUF3326 domain-containing protein [Steroidobacteraceae bacterium]|nr:DUF3326 domain-containing protein [Steroidobacteraceae bacterium]